MMKKILFLLFLFSAFFLSLPRWQSVKAASTYYVSPSGSDTNLGTQEQPWQTVQKAATTLRAGDTVLIRKGTYNIPSEIVPVNSGTSSSYITYKAYQEETPLIKGSYASGNWNGINLQGKSYIVIEGLTIQGFHTGIVCRAPGHHVIARNNELRYNSEVGFSSTNKASGDKETCDYLTVENNRIHDNGYKQLSDGTVVAATGDREGWGSGISINAHSAPYMFDTDYSHLHTVIRNNFIYHNYDGTGGDVDSEADHTDGNGIILDMVGNMPPSLIENNMVFNNGGRCITWKWSQNFWIVGNTCYKNTWDTAAKYPFQEIFGASNNTSFPLKNGHVLNNIVYALASNRALIKVDGTYASADLDIRNNVLYNGQTILDGENVIKLDPLFVGPSLDPGTANFRLKPTSPAINSGTSDFRIAGVQAADYYGTTRPQGAGFDRGAVESGGSATPTLPSSPTPTPTGSVPTLVPMTIPGEIIIDNKDAGFSTVYGQEPWLEYIKDYPENYRGSHHHNLNIGTGLDKATFSFTVPKRGRYQIFAWWWAMSTRPTDVPYTVNHVNGSTVIKVNQTIAGGAWNLLGTFGLQDSGSVVVSDKATNGHEIDADAIRLLYKEPIPGDVNLDGVVDGSDSQLVIQNFGNTTCQNLADVDQDCDVDIFDFNFVVENFNKTE